MFFRRSQSVAVAPLSDQKLLSRYRAHGKVADLAPRGGRSGTGGRSIQWPPDLGTPAGNDTRYYCRPR